METSALQIIYKIALGLGGLGVCAGGIGYFWGKINGGNKEAKAESTDLISDSEKIKNFYKEQNEELKVINKTLGDKVEALTREVGEIRGQLNAETKQKADILAILQGRDPETKKFMEFMVQAVKDQTESHQKIVDVLSEIHKMAKDEHERDFKVEATVTKT